MEERTRAGSIVAAAFSALGIGLGVALVAGIIVSMVQSQWCTPDEECLAVVAGIGYGLLGGTAAAMLTFVVLAVRFRLGAIVGACGAVTILALVAAAWAAPLGFAWPFLLLAAAAIIGTAIVTNRTR